METWRYQLTLNGDPGPSGLFSSQTDFAAVFAKLTRMGSIPDWTCGGMRHDETGELIGVLLQSRFDGDHYELTAVRI